MKRVVAVSLSELLGKDPSWYYLGKASRYDVECTKLDTTICFFKDKYVLELKGTSENIQLFLDYLRCNGFKIK